MSTMYYVTISLIYTTGIGNRKKSIMSHTSVNAEGYRYILARPFSCGGHTWWALRSSCPRRNSNQSQLQYMLDCTGATGAIRMILRILTF